MDLRKWISKLFHKECVDCNSFFTAKTGYSWFQNAGGPTPSESEGFLPIYKTKQNALKYFKEEDIQKIEINFWDEGVYQLIEKISIDKIAKKEVKESKTTESSSPLPALTDETFRALAFDYTNPTAWILKPELPCFFIFYTNNCFACNIMMKVMEELALLYEGRMLFYKIDANTEIGLRQRMGINTVPKLLIWGKDSKSPNQQIEWLKDGLTSDELKIKIESFI